mmetsp:Transcript_31084/g.50650  ORF Transcript_31084/g.50650 Transcript_31084/m.50650 type:complete len:118 (+) Transcript_31084:63-416(+)
MAPSIHQIVSTITSSIKRRRKNTTLLIVVICEQKQKPRPFNALPSAELTMIIFTKSTPLMFTQGWYYVVLLGIYIFSSLLQTEVVVGEKKSRKQEEGRRKNRIKAALGVRNCPTTQE